MAAPRGKKKRQPKPPRTAATPKPGGPISAQEAAERFGPSLTPIPMRGNSRVLQNILGGAEGDALIELLIPFVWAGISEGVPSNICVDAALTLQQAYAQFGIVSHLRAVDLVVEQADGRRRLYGSPAPGWSGPDNSVYNGHAVLVLPAHGRYVDVTVEQFKEVRRHGLGPLVGKAVASTVDISPGVDFYTAGMQMAAQRGDTLLLYTVADDEYSDQLNAYAHAHPHPGGHHRTGVNLASIALMALRNPGVIDRARKAPYPRLQALLDAVGDAEEVTIERDFYFLLPGPDGRPAPTAIDQIPLEIPVPGQ